MFRRGLFYSYLSIYLRHFLGLSVTETTLFATLPMIMNIVFQTFVWGAFSDKHQLRKTLIVRGEFLAGFGTILVWYAHTLAHKPLVAGYVVIIGLSLIEIFWSMSNVGWSALISDIYRQEDRSSVQGYLASVGGIGRFAGIWIGGLLYDGLNLKYNGWGFERGALFFVASGAMFISIIPMLLVPEGGIQQEQKSTAALPPIQPESSTHIYVFFLFAMTFINFGRNSIAVILSQYLVLDTGFAVSSRVLSYIANTQSVAMVFTGLFAGWLAKRWDDEKCLLLGAGMAVGALILLATTMDIRLIYFSSFLRGCSEVLIMAASYAIASVLIPMEKRARLFSLFNATFFLSWGLAGTFIAGPIVDLLVKSGSPEVFAYQMAFISAAVITFLGLIFQWFLTYVFIPKSSGVK